MDDPYIYLVNDKWVTPTWMVQRIRELEAKLEEAKALPEKWRGFESALCRKAYSVCADELESCLSGNIDNEVKR